MNTKIDSITRLPNLKMEIKSAQLPAPEQFDYVFNCSWFSVDQLNRTFESSTQQPINHIESNNRIKVMAVLTNIPETLKNKSILLGFGPYSSLITRITDGVEEGYLTSERITNFAQISSNSTMSEEQLALVTDKLPNHRKRAIGELIIDDAKKFIPPLAECELSKLKAGVVRTNGGPIDIYARDGHFSRTFMGVYHVALGLIVNEARKFIFWNKNCNKAIELLQEQIAVKSQIDSILDRTMNQSKRSEDLLKVLACHVDQEVIGKAPLETDTASNNLKKNLGIFATTSDRKIETNNTIRLFASYRSELAENTKLAVALKKF